MGERGISVDLLWDGPLRENDFLEQIEIVDRRVATRVDGLILAPQHSVISSAAVRRARGESIPVVVIDSGLADREAIERYVATDNYRGGWLAGQHLAEVLRESGKAEPFRLMLLRYAIGSESTEQRENGFLDYFDASKERFRQPGDSPPPKIDWIDTNHYAGATRDSASRAAAPLVQQFGDKLDGIFASNESAASGVLDVLRSQNRNRGSHANGIVLMAFDSSQSLLQAVQEGDVAGTIIQDPYWMGYLSTWSLVRYLEGDDINDRRRAIDISTGEYLVTRDNLSARATQEKYDPAAQSQRVFDPPQFPRREMPR